METLISKAALRTLISLRTLSALKPLGSLKSLRTLGSLRSLRSLWTRGTRDALDARLALSTRGALGSRRPLSSGRRSRRSGDAGGAGRPRHARRTAAGESCKYLAPRETLDAGPYDGVDVLQARGIIRSFRFAQAANPATPHVFIKVAHGGRLFLSTLPLLLR